VLARGKLAAVSEVEALKGRLLFMMEMYNPAAILMSFLAYERS
jgi:hypothetical protein